MYNIVQASRHSSVGIANMLLAGRFRVLNPEMEGGLSLLQIVSFFQAPQSLKINEHRVNFLPIKHRECGATKLRMSRALCLFSLSAFKAWIRTRSAFEFCGRKKWST
jgi:hypothetical protein